MLPAQPKVGVASFSGFDTHFDSNMNGQHLSHSDGEDLSASQYDSQYQAGFHSEGDDFGGNTSSGSKSGKRGPPIPAFLKKTYDILERPEYREYCSWGPNNDSLIVNKVSKFSTIVLPQFFKHSNYASFVRQLNMYGFHKTGSDPQCREFKHPYFIRGRPDLLSKIKRKINSSKTQPNEGALFKRGKGEAEALVEQVTSIMSRQTHLESALEQMRQENLKMKAERQDLWSELEASRQRQAALQARTQRIVMFLFQLYQAHRRQKELDSGHGLPKALEPGTLDAPDLPIEMDREGGVSPTQLFNSDMMDLLSRESPSLMDWAKSYQGPPAPVPQVPSSSSRRFITNNGNATTHSNKRRRVSHSVPPSPDLLAAQTPTLGSRDTPYGVSPPIPAPPASPLSGFLADDIPEFATDDYEPHMLPEDEEEHGRASSRAAVAMEEDYSTDYPGYGQGVHGAMSLPPSAVAGQTAPAATIPKTSVPEGFKPFKPGVVRIATSNPIASPAASMAISPEQLAVTLASAGLPAEVLQAVTSSSSAAPASVSPSSASYSLDLDRILKEQASLRNTQQLANNRAHWLEETLHIPSSYVHFPASQPGGSPQPVIPLSTVTQSLPASYAGTSIPVSIPASIPASIPLPPSTTARLPAMHPLSPHNPASSLPIHVSPPPPLSGGLAPSLSGGLGFPHNGYSHAIPQSVAVNSASLPQSK